MFVALQTLHSRNWPPLFPSGAVPLDRVAWMRTTSGWETESLPQKTACQDIGFLASAAPALLSSGEVTGWMPLPEALWKVALNCLIL